MSNEESCCFTVKFPVEQLFHRQVSRGTVNMSRPCCSTLRTPEPGMLSPDLPEISPLEFEENLRRISPQPLPARAVDALFKHYQELRRWNRSLSLIGPGTVQEVLSRHYGESLAALALIPDGFREILDLGSGAGFPGLVLAAVLPGARVTLVEARQKKWAFLEAAARNAALSCRGLNVRVALSLPPGLPTEIDLITARAIKLPGEVLSRLAERMSAEGRMLFWAGEDLPERPPSWEVSNEVPLVGSVRRRIVEFRRTTNTSG